MVDQAMVAAVSPRHAMTIDVEDYFHVHALAPHLPRARWEELPRRVRPNTERLLDMMAEAGTKATFFVLGWVAARDPGIVRRIVDEGHELASHGQMHHKVSGQSRADFRADLRTSRKLLEDLGGVAVNGYRAPSFSIDRGTPWAYQELAEAGYRYSSSAHPVAYRGYGQGDGRRTIHEHDGVLELPVATVEVAGRALPFAGGAWFRLFPDAWTHWSLRRSERQSPDPVIFYLHPWEIDPGQPRVPGLPWKTRVRHYGGLAKVERRLARLLRAARWDRLDRAHPVLAARLAS